MPDSDNLLTADSVATRLSVSVRSLRRYADRGELVPVRIGRRVRYRVSDVEQLLAEREDTSGHQEHSGGQRTADTPLVADMSAPAPHSPTERPGEAAGLAGVSAQAVEALREQLAAVMAENVALRQDAMAKAEAAGLWQGRALTLEAQLKQLTAGVDAPQATPATPGAPEAREPSAATPTPSGGLWQRFRAALLGH